MLCHNLEIGGEWAQSFNQPHPLFAKTDPNPLMKHPQARKGPKYTQLRNDMNAKASS